MSVLASRCENNYSGFSKNLFTDVSDNVRIFSDKEWEENNDEYKKVLFAIYIRTDKQNLVLMVDEGKFASIFESHPVTLSGGVYPNILVDSGMMCSKLFVEQALNFDSDEALQTLCMNSACYPVGAVETSKNYILVFNVIVSTDILSNPNIHLNEGFHLHPIETLSIEDSLQRDISDSLVIVKSEV